MEIKYSLTEADVLALNKFRTENDPLLKKRIRRARFKLTIGFAVVAFGFWLIDSNLFIVAWFLFLSLLSLIFYNSYYDWRIRRRISEMYREQKYQKTLAPRTLVAISEGLIESSSLGEMKVEWRTIDGFYQTATHVFISVGQVVSIMIPKSIVSTDELAAFIKTCRTFKKESA
jgi:hypothetical protein